jgi:hypothetical protein
MKTSKGLLFIYLLMTIILFACKEEEPPQGPKYFPINRYGSIYLTDRNTPKSLAGHPFINTITGLTYILDTAKKRQDSVDFLYYYGTGNIRTDSNSIASPAATVFSNPITTENPWPELLDWTIKNGTTFKNITDSLTHDLVDEVQNDSILQKYAVNLTDTKINKLKIGSIIAFQTIKGKKGIFVVENIENTSAVNRALTIAMIVQQ